MVTKRKRGRLPRSGDALVDWHFQQIIYFLKNKVDGIFLKDKYLKDPYKKRVILEGYIYINIKGRAVIFISSAKNVHSDRKMMGKTLTHEVTHGFLKDCVHEKNILRLENLLWDSFTLEQKRMIISFLPKHKVKKAPETA